MVTTLKLSTLVRILKKTDFVIQLMQKISEKNAFYDDYYKEVKNKTLLKPEANSP